MMFVWQGRIERLGPPRTLQLNACPQPVTFKKFSLSLQVPSSRLSGSHTSNSAGEEEEEIGTSSSETGAFFLHIHAVFWHQTKIL